MRDHRLAELAPRDRGARDRSGLAAGRKDLPPMRDGWGWLRSGSLGSTRCARRWIDPSRQLIPVRGAPRWVGSSWTSLEGPQLRDSMPAARVWTGVHGANRLASNSLLEGLISPGVCARSRQTRRSRRCRGKTGRFPLLADRGAAQVATDAIRLVMGEYTGIADCKGLRSASGSTTSSPGTGAPEEANMAETARLIVEAALMRKESRGGHYRSDFPRAKRKWTGRHIEW
jgi:L-aspartate oxidase